MGTQEVKLKAIADAIREKDGTAEPIPAADFPDRIRAISTTPEGLHTITVEANDPDGGTVSDETPETEPDMVFGLPRRTFHLVVIGYALGVIAVGLLGLAGLVDENTGTVLPGVLGAALGYLLAKYLGKRSAKDTPDEPK